MRTIGKTWKRSHRGSNAANCDYCGALYARVELRRDRTGFLACDQDFGRDLATLDEGNAAAARRHRRQPPVKDLGAKWPETISTDEYLMVPSTANITDPHTGLVIPLAGIVAYVDLQWLWLKQKGQITFAAVP